MTKSDNLDGMDGLLSGVVVADLTRVLAGPFATMIMADLGARVIKVEPPGGDDSRQFGPFAGRKSAYFESLNRGKESIALNLKSPGDRAVFEKLIARADILAENYRAGALAKLNYDWETLQAINPRLIYAAVSGFGQTGPCRDLPAYDLVIQAMGGLVSITGHADQPPARAGTSVVDIAAGLFGVCGILAALYRRERSGRGEMLDIAMLDCQVAILENAIGRHLANGEIPQPLGLRHPSITPFDGFKIGDDYLIIAVGNDALFKKLCAVLNADDLATDARFISNALRTDNHIALKTAIETALAKHPAGEWLGMLRAAGIPCAPINTIAQVVEDAQVTARNMIIESVDHDGARVRMGGNPIKTFGRNDPKVRACAPKLNANRMEIINWLNDD